MTDKNDAMLMVENGIDGRAGIPLDKVASFLGSSPGVDIVVDNAYVSRLHARIDLEGRRFTIRDLGSKNGTLLNGDRLNEHGRPLRDGDGIELAGGQVVLRFMERAATPALEAVPGAPTSGVVVDSASREVWVRESQVNPLLSHKEFDVLNLIYERAG